jgi:hypothetical protein
MTKKSTNKSAKSPAPATKATPATTPASVSSETKAFAAKTPRARTKKTPAAAPAPATVAVEVAPAPVAIAVPAAPAPAPAPVAAPTPVPAEEAKSLVVAALTVAAAPKAVTAKPVVTTLTACIDVGFGNTLYLRGEGPGLSWDQGVPMDCISSDQWQLTLPESARPLVVKFLINDQTWSVGPDYTVPAGTHFTIAPQF